MAHVTSLFRFVSLAVLLLTLSLLILDRPLLADELAFGNQVEQVHPEEVCEESRQTKKKVGPAKLSASRLQGGGDKFGEITAADAPILARFGVAV